MIKNMVFLLAPLLLAIISKEHYSKYKGVKGGVFVMLFLGMADYIYTKIEKYLKLDLITDRVRKLFVVSPKRANILAREYMVKSIFYMLIVLTGSSLMAIFFDMANIEQKNSNIIEREDHQGTAKQQKITLISSDEEYEYEMEINPLEYTKSEFKQRADEIFMELETEILGTNLSLDNVVDDLNLVSVSADGEFAIDWRSMDTDYISSYGKIDCGKQILPKKTSVIATICYLDYEESHTYNITICNKDDKNSQFQNAASALDKLEAESRQSSTIELPEEIRGVRISIAQKRTSAFLLVVIGIVISVALLLLRQEKMKESIEKRNQELINEYPVFVNKIWLLIGTGMNIKDALIKIVKENRKRDILMQEIEYTINQIQSGYSEFAAYEELGIRIGLAPYGRIMNRISQNIRKGNKDLRILLEEEVYLALNERRECIKKKGEEASTKMLFPMILLLGIVMVIVMFPAMSNF